MLHRCFPFFVLLLCACPTLTARAIEYPHQDIPGVVIDYSPAASGKYIGCPAIAILPNGSYVASHTFFWPRRQAAQRNLGFQFVRPRRDVDQVERDSRSVLVEPLRPPRRALHHGPRPKMG